MKAKIKYKHACITKLSLIVLLLLIADAIAKADSITVHPLGSFVCEGQFTRVVSKTGNVFSITDTWTNDYKVISVDGIFAQYINVGDALDMGDSLDPRVFSLHWSIDGYNLDLSNLIFVGVEDSVIVANEFSITGNGFENLVEPGPIGESFRNFVGGTNDWTPGTYVRTTQLDIGAAYFTVPDSGRTVLMLASSLILFFLCERLTLKKRR